MFSNRILEQKENKARGKKFAGKFAKKARRTFSQLPPGIYCASPGCGVAFAFGGAIADKLARGAGSN
jgi:hypothetical protein